MEPFISELLLKLETVKKVYNKSVITKELVKDINPELEDFDQLKADLDGIGYEYQL